MTLDSDDAALTRLSEADVVWSQDVDVDALPDVRSPASHGAVSPDGLKGRATTQAPPAGADTGGRWLCEGVAVRS